MQITGRCSKRPNRFEVITELIEKRDFLYRSTADFTVDTDFKNPEEAADEILQRIEK